MEIFENQELLARRRETVKLAELERKEIEALNNWVLIRKKQVADKESAGGIVLTETQSRSQGGIVISVPEFFTDAMGNRHIPFVKEGDEVIYTNFPIELEDLEEITGDKFLHLVRAEEIYAKLRPAKQSA